MDAMYVMGLLEIDQEHDEICSVANTLQQVIANKEQRHLTHATMKNLHELLVTHFAHEETFMKMAKSGDAAEHIKMHKGVLRLFDDYFSHPPAVPADYDYLGKLIREKVLGHIAELDVPMTESIKRQLHAGRRAASADFAEQR